MSDSRRRLDGLSGTVKPMISYAVEVEQDSKLQLSLFTSQHTHLVN